MKVRASARVRVLVVAIGAVAGAILSGLAAPVDAADFDGNGRTDIAVFRPSNGRWYTHTPASTIAHGTAEDIPIPGDYDGNGTVDRAVYRPSTGRWYTHGTGGSVSFGIPGDIPVPGQYDADTATDRAIFRPSTGRWYIEGTPGSTHFGLAGDVPMATDFDGNGQADIAVYRPSNGRWYTRTPASTIAHGTAEDIPIPGDYDGNGTVDRAVYRPSTGRWYTHGTGGSVSFGIPGDIPVPGQYDADTATDRAIFRPSTGRWYIEGTPGSTHFGLAGDVPTALAPPVYLRYVQQEPLGPPAVVPTLPVLGVAGQDEIVRQEYTYTGFTPGSIVDITFVPCFVVGVDSSGATTIADVPPGPPAAAPDDDAAGAELLGWSVSSALGRGEHTTIAFVDGEVAFANHVDGFVVPAGGQFGVELLQIDGDCAVPVVFGDAADDDRIELQPDTDRIGPGVVVLGGPLVFSRDEAANGQAIEGMVVFHDPVEHYFVLDDTNTDPVDGTVFFYEADDEFTYDANIAPLIGAELTVSMSEFASWLSPLDHLGGSGVAYSRSAPNSFQIQHDTAGQVRGVVAQLGDFDDVPGDTASNDARIHWTMPDRPGGFVDDFIAYVFVNGVPHVIAHDSDDDPAGTPPEPNQDVNNDGIDDDVDHEVIVEDLPPGSYRVIVRASTAAGGTGPFDSEPADL